MERLAIANPFPGAAAFLVDRTSSTQEEAKRLAASGYPPGSLVAANEQTAGRGRFPERGWESEPGKNLLFTLYLGPRAALLPALPIRVGLALCGAVSDYASEVDAALASPLRLKWPNDLVLGDRKAAGILCESPASGPGSGAFAGIGLNCNQLRFPPSLEGKATSLALELGREADLKRLAAELGLGPGGGAGLDWRGAATELLWRRGETVSFLPALSARAEGGVRPRPAPLRGVLEGLDEEGSALIRVEGEPGARAYASGELTAAPSANKVEP